MAILYEDSFDRERGIGYALWLDVIGVSYWGAAFYNMVFLSNGSPLISRECEEIDPYFQKKGVTRGTVIEDDFAEPTLLRFLERMARRHGTKEGRWQSIHDEDSHCIALYPGRLDLFRKPDMELSGGKFLLLATSDSPDHDAPNGIALMMNVTRTALRRFARRVRAEYEAKRAALPLYAKEDPDATDYWNAGKEETNVCPS